MPMNKLLTRGKLWRLCPYSTQASQDLRVPAGQKTNHTSTNGTMIITHGGTFRCYDDVCSFYTGAATTPIVWKRWDGCTQTVVSGTLTPTAGERFSES